MADRGILRSQANEILGLLQEAGLIPSDFRWEDRESTFPKNGTVSALVHRPTGYYFKFDYSDQGHWAEFSPGEDKIVDVQHPGSWKFQRGYAELWVKALAREVNEPDLWESIASESLLVAAADRTEDTGAFSAEERLKIRESLAEIRQYCLQALALSQEQARVITTRLDYLASAAERMSRKDWLLLAAGVLMNIVVAAAFTPSLTRELFRFAGQALQWVVGERLMLP